MDQLSQGTERRSSHRFPLLSRIHLMADFGQILIGSLQNISSHGLKAEFPKNIGRNTVVSFSFSHEKTCIRGDGRVVWSESAGNANRCGIAFLRMKQKDEGFLNRLLERIPFPRCPVCDSKIDIEKFTPFFEMYSPRDRIDLRNASPFVEMARIISSGFPRETVIQKALEVIKSHLHAKAIELLLYNKKTGDLELSIHPGWHSRDKFSLNLEKSIADKVLSEKRIIFIPDVRKDPSFVNDDQAKAWGIRSMAAIPLIEGGRAFGMLALYTPLLDQREILKREEKELLSAFGSLIAIAMKRQTSMVPDAMNESLPSRRL